MDLVMPDELKLDEGRRLLDAADADVLVVGHSHVAFALEIVGRGWIVNPGAVLRDPAPGGDNPPATATFGVLTLPSAAFSVYGVTTGAEERALRRSVVW
jgi:predicted phosphodiesterase